MENSIQDHVHMNDAVEVWNVDVTAKEI